MLHQAFVGDFQWNILLAWTATNPSRTVLVYYPVEVLSDYGALLAEPFIRDMFEWLHVCCSGNTSSDNEIYEHIPKFASGKVKLLLKSNVPLLRAVLTYAKKLSNDTPFEPTHTFRVGIIALYDFLKGGTDVECRAFADAWKGCTYKFHATTKMTMRLLYTPLVVAAKAVSIYEYVERLGLNNLPTNLREFRHAVRKQTPINDIIWKFGAELHDSLLPFGALHTLSNQNFNYATPGHKSRSSNSAESLVDVDVIAANPEAMKDYLIGRAVKEGRDIDHLDFVTNTKIPVASGARSGTTPGSLIFTQSHVKNTAKLIETVNQRPKSGAHRSTKLDFWLTEGLLLRLNPLIAHPMVKTTSRAPCFWCVAKPRESLACIFCGESFCSLPCEQAFHKNMYGFSMPEEGEEPSTTTKKVLNFADSPKLAKKRSKKQSEEAIDSAIDNE
jgi:hypothetical protein